jgi:hypothetical protein
VSLTTTGTIKAVGEAQAVARWLTVLKKHKSELVSFLRVRSAEQATNSRWATKDWLELYDERAAIAEFDGGLSRERAEKLAFEHCVAEWLMRHPVQSSPGLCLGCGRGVEQSGIVLPFGTEANGHAWLHPDCWPAWHAERKAEAITDLAAMGIAPPAGFLRNSKWDTHGDGIGSD